MFLQRGIAWSIFQNIIIVVSVSIVHKVNCMPEMLNGQFNVVFYYQTMYAKCIHLKNFENISFEMVD